MVRQVGGASADLIFIDFVFFVKIYLQFFIGFVFFVEICFKFFIDHGTEEEAQRPGVQASLPHALSGYR